MSYLINPYRFRVDGGLYGDSILAFSLRLLVDSYTGDCIRVRRDSDNAESDIGFSSSVLDESALTTFVGANNGYVVKWYNQGSISGDFENTTGANEPLIVSSGTVVTDNGKPAMTVGSSDFLLHTNWGVTNVYSAFVVTQLNASNRPLIIGTTSTGYTNFLRRTTNGEVRFRHNVANAVYDPSIVASTQTSMAFYRYDSSNSAFTYNGSGLTDQALSGNWVVPNITLGTINAKTQELVYFDYDKRTDESDILTDQNSFYSVY